MLVIRCQFLQGSYQASDATVGLDAPEWPPHPARLHAAFVASAWALGDGSHPQPEAAAALRWLELEPPPSIAAPGGAAPRGAGTFYVPRNPVSAELGRYRREIRKGNTPVVPERGPRSFATTVTGDDPVEFVWQAADAGVHREPLTALAREVAYLGSSRSPVCCDVVDEPGAATHVPVELRGDATLRVAVEGFTDALLERRRDFPPSTFGAFQPYAARPTPTGDVGVVDGPFASELLVLRFVDSFPLTLAHAALVTRALRSAVLAQAGDDAPAALHGHAIDGAVVDPHTAFLALADVGHRHASGGVVGVAVAVPRGLAAAARDAILAAARRVKRLRVDRRLTPATLAPGGELRALAPARWIGPARVWRTVTPIIADRHPKRASGGLDGALRAAFRHAHLPAPERLRVSHAPFVTGAAPAAAHRGELPPGLRLHVEASFDRPLRGPVLVGRGRYFGVGLFAPERG